MAWQQLRVVTTDQFAEQLEDVLFGLGALSITLGDAADEAVFIEDLDAVPLWNDVLVLALFAEDIDTLGVLANLQNAFADGPLRQMAFEFLGDQDWLQACRDQFKPVLLGDKLCVCPSWHLQRDAEKTNIILDPGLAFGTGAHPTTQLCLEWLEQTVNATDHVVDYGCGSGVLAIASHHLGARKVFAIDHDEQAVTATNNNCQHNHIHGEHFITGLDTQLKPVAMDIVVANILKNPLIALASHFVNMLKPGGHIALAGILAQQADDVIAAYADIKPLHVGAERDGWVLLVG